MNPIAAATSSGLFLATIYNQSQLAERKHVARYWSINTAVTAVPLIAHPFSTEDLSYSKEISGGHIGRGLFGGNVLPAQYCPCGRERQCIVLLLLCCAAFKRDAILLPFWKIDYYNVTIFSAVP